MRQSIGRFIVGLVLVTGVGAGTGLGAALLAPGVAGATGSFTVNDVGDFGLADGSGTTCASTNVVDETNTCTLRAALEAANNLGQPTTITLPNPLDAALAPGPAYVLDNGTGGLGQLLISDSGGTVTIDGAGQNLVSIQGAATPVTRVLKVNTGDSAVISGVTVQDGDASSSGEVGGGILNCGTLTLSQSTVTDNQTNDGDGGGIYQEGGVGNTTLDDDTVTDNSGADGGGVYAEGGTMTIEDTQINDNTSSDEGGGIFVEGQSPAATSFTMEDGSGAAGNTAAGGGGGFAVDGSDNAATVLAIENSTLSNNTVGGDEPGGGILQNVESTLTVSNSTISGNTPTEEGSTEGGGAYLEDAGSLDTFTDVTINGNNEAEDGAGVYVEAGDPNFTGGTISDNTAESDGGGVYLDGGTSTFSAVTISNNAAEVGGGVYASDGTNTFDDDAINDNVSSGDNYGGGVYTGGGTETFTGGSVSDNTAYLGAGIFISDGTNTMTQLTVAGNTATEAGGGVVVNDATTSITTTITKSTISGNTAEGTVGFTYELGDGGGILDSLCNTLVLTNDTIVNNVAGGQGRGGGYEGEGCGTAGTNTAFLFDTVTDNSAGDPSGGGNIQLSDSSSVTLGETIVAGGIVNGTPGTNCAIDGGAAATFTSKGYNLIDDTTCGTSAGTDVIGQGPQLGPLADNGGPTQTELPAANSPAVGRIPAATCSATAVATDQRGEPRGTGLNGACTIGAVEVVAPAQNNFNGYRLVADDGGIFDFGLNFNGSLAESHLNAPIVGLANSPGPNGYLLVGKDGGVFALGGANFYGSLGGQAIASPIAAIAAPPSETGYWLVAQNGKIYPFGSVPALPAVLLPPGAAIVGMASTTDGQGAWLTDNRGDVYAEGSAQYEGGLGGTQIAAPIVGIAAAAAGQGYALVGADGGVFTYGTQDFFGSVPGALKPGTHIAAPVVGIAVTHSGNGYWAVGADGGVYAFGDAPFLGSTYTTVPGDKLNGPIVGIQHLGAAAA